MVLPAPEPVLPEDGAFVDGDGVVRFRDPQTGEVIDYPLYIFLATLPVMCSLLTSRSAMTSCTRLIATHR